MIGLGGHQESRLPGSEYQHHVTDFALTSDGRRLIVSRGGGGMNRVECWAIRRFGSFEPLWSILDGQPVDPETPYLLNQADWFTNAVAFRKDGDLIATAESRSTGGLSYHCPLLAIRDGTTGRLISELGHSVTSFASSLAFSHDGKSLFVWDDQAIERWDLTTHKRTAKLPPARGRAHFRGLAVHPAGRALLTASGSCACCWDPIALTPLHKFTWSVGTLYSIAINEDGTLAAAGADKGQVVMWDLDE